MCVCIQCCTVLTCPFVALSSPSCKARTPTRRADPDRRRRSGVESPPINATDISYRTDMPGHGRRKGVFGSCPLYCKWVSRLTVASATPTDWHQVPAQGMAPSDLLEATTGTVNGTVPGSHDKRAGDATAGASTPEPRTLRETARSLGVPTSLLPKDQHVFERYGEAHAPKHSP